MLTVSLGDDLINSSLALDSILVEALMTLPYRCVPERRTR